MIIDSIQNASKYFELHPLFQKAFDAVNSLDYKTLEASKIELQGEDLFLNIVDADLKKTEDATVETHDQYIDIQIPVSDEETYGWIAREKCHTLSMSYDADRDLAFYADKPTIYFTLQPGEFAIFFPEDGHAPAIGNKKIRKLILKVKL